MSTLREALERAWKALKEAMARGWRAYCEASELYPQGYAVGA